MKLRITLAAVVLALASGLTLAPAALAQTPGGTGTGGPGSTSTPGTTSKPAPARGTEIDLPIGLPSDSAFDEDDPKPPDNPEDDDVTIYDEDIPTKTDSIIYVIDISGSMEWDEMNYTGLDGQTRRGNRLDRAKVELIKSIQGLRSNFEFNVLAFDCDIRTWSPNKQKAEPGPKAAAIGWVNHLQPMGATGTGPATAQALQDKNNFAVVLLSDGAPNCGANSINGHLRMIQNANTQHAVIITFGIACYGEFERFMRDVATTSGGTYHAVP